MFYRIRTNGYFPASRFYLFKFLPQIFCRIAFFRFCDFFRRALGRVHADTDADDEAANAAQRAAFHESEERADVEAPAATTDSLGAGLDSILARRGN